MVMLTYLCRPFFNVILVLSLFGMTQAQLETAPTPEALTDIKYIGVIVDTKTSKECHGAFLTLKFLVTSCRCIGYTDIKTGIFTQGKPESYKVRTWNNSTDVTLDVAKLHFHAHCGSEPRKVLLDLGLVETKIEFSSSAVQPVDLPNAQLFRFYEYIFRLQVQNTICLSSDLKNKKGSSTYLTVLSTAYCPVRKLCESNSSGVCQFLTLQTNHICGIPTPESPPVNTVLPIRPLGAEKCPVAGGAPIICHGLLVGINSMGADCNGPFNPNYFIRMDFPMSWIMNTVCT